MIFVCLQKIHIIEAVQISIVHNLFFETLSVRVYTIASIISGEGVPNLIPIFPPVVGPVTPRGGNARYDLRATPRRNYRGKTVYFLISWTKSHCARDRRQNSGKTSYFRSFLGTMILGTVLVLIGLMTGGASAMPMTKLHGCFRYGTTLQCSIHKFRSFIFPDVAEDRNLKSVVFGNSHPLGLNCEKLPGNILIFFLHARV